MKISYISHTRFPTEKAHGHQIARVCEALTQLQHDVTLVAPDIRRNVMQDFKKYYALRSAFSLVLLPTKDALLSKCIPGRFAFYFTMRSYRASLSVFLTKHRSDLLYTRSPHLLSILLSTRLPVLLELHTLPRYGRRRFVWLCNRCKRIVCLTTPMRNELVTWGVDPKKTIVEGDAVDLERFSALPSAKSAKRTFNLPADAKVIGYVGSLITMDSVEKGVDLLFRAAMQLKKLQYPVFVFVVGGPAAWCIRYRKAALHAGLTEESFHFQGHIASKRVPEAMAACDILVYPAPAKKHPYFLRDTSPLKLFEYLASGRPVVCADIPPIRDIVDASVVRFARPGSASSLAGAIRDVLDHPNDAKTRASKSLEIIREHTWKKRMDRIVQGLNIENNS